MIDFRSSITWPLRHRVTQCTTGDRLTNLWLGFRFHDLALWMAGPLLLRLALLIFFSFSSQAAQVYWSSPAAGTVFGPGDTLIANWTANSTSSKVSKNSTTVFRLCETDFQGPQNGSATSCGEVVTPLIQQSAGSYIASLQVSVFESTLLLPFCNANRLMLSISSAVPNVTNKVGVYLEMNDASGLESISPNFSLSRTTIFCSHFSIPRSDDTQLYPGF